MSKRKEIRERRLRQQKRTRWVVTGLVSVGALLVIALLVFTQFQQTAQVRSRPSANGNAMGDPNAPITITEFADFHCSHCGDFAIETEPKLEENYVQTGKVYFIYRTMGGWLSDESLVAGEAAYCAADQNLFWEYHDILYQNQLSPFTITNLEKWGRKVGLDMNAFDACLTNHTNLQRAQQDEQDGRAAGVEGTPTFFIKYTVNGQEKQQVLPGAYPYDAFKQQLDDILTEMGLQ